MSFARNALDASRVYFEDDGGEGAPVVFHGGLVDSVASSRQSQVAQGIPRDEFRLVFVDHRGLGRSDKPHDVDAYAMPLRVADAIAVLDELGVERAHFVGNSWGGRLGFGIGEHRPDRVLSLVLGGQQPYAIDPDGPLVEAVTASLAVSRREGTVRPFVDTLGLLSDVPLPDALRAQWLDNDAAALDAAWQAALAEGAISADLSAWQLPCLIYAAVGDADFYEQARRAAEEIPGAEFLAIAEHDHVGAHLRHDAVLPAVLRTLRAVR